METDPSLPIDPARARLMRLESALVLKRWLHLERALVVAAAGWVPAVARIETKALLARTAWQGSLTAEALKQRVLELRYPERDLDPGRCALVTLYEAALSAPGPGALLGALAGVLLPALRGGYEAYLEASDEIADGPSRRFLGLAVAEKRAQEGELAAAAGREPDAASEASAEWIGNLAAGLERVGGVGLEPPADAEIELVVPPGRRFRSPRRPARDDRYFVSSFYWPDILDPSYAYGHGIRLQLRSAVSHINEVWAVEAAAATLQHFAGELGWEFTLDAARWLFDESRHMMMGARRLEWWGFERHEVPLGSYIIEALEDQDPIYRLAMLAFFETKNIGKKRERAGELGGLGDLSSQRDMDFDWADEAIHTGYGRRWLRAALQSRDQDPQTWTTLVARCEELVRERVARATPHEADAIRACATRLVERAEELARGPNGRTDQPSDR